LNGGKWPPSWPSWETNPEGSLLTTLEREAVKSHHAGEDWDTFWRRISAAVRDSARFNARKYHDIHLRLFLLQHHGDVPLHTPATWWADSVAQEAAVH
jgi:hypothetical protein